MGRPLAILLRSEGHEAAHYALVVATAAAAIGRDVTLFGTNAGCRLFLAVTPLLADPREAALEARGVAGIGTLLAAARELHIRLQVCQAGLLAEALEGAPLAEGVMVSGVVGFLAAAGDGQLLAL